MDLDDKGIVPESPRMKVKRVFEAAQNEKNEGLCLEDCWFVHLYVCRGQIRADRFSFSSVVSVDCSTSREERHTILVPVSD